MRDLISAAYAKLIVAGIVSIVLPTIPHMDRDLRQHGSRVACPPGPSPPGLIAAALAFAVARRMAETGAGVVFMVGLRRSRLVPSDRASRARDRATRRELRSSRPRVAGRQGA